MGILQRSCKPLYQRVGDYFRIVRYPPLTGAIARGSAKALHIFGLLCVVFVPRAVNSFAIWRAQSPSCLIGFSKLFPKFVSSYSTRGGMMGYTVLVIRPSRCNSFSVSVSIR